MTFKALFHVPCSSFYRDHIIFQYAFCFYRCLQGHFGTDRVPRWFLKVIPTFLSPNSTIFRYPQSIAISVVAFYRQDACHLKYSQQRHAKS